MTPEVRAILIPKLDRLSPEIKEVVQMASVLGRQFEVKVLREMVQNDSNLTQKMDLMPGAIFSMQGPQQERLFGSAIRYHLDQRFAREKSLIIGTWYRMNDAAIASFGVSYPIWDAIISYDFNTSDFEHLAFYNVDKSRIEMHLKALKNLEVRSKYTSQTIKIKKGETIHTENSHKFNVNQLKQFGSFAELTLENVFFDSQKRFSLAYYLKYC